ncbi:MAG: hypothetical protein RLZZ468_409, partial [Cyanobacteriota bacterium]
QWPLARKRPLADEVIDNRSAEADLHAQVDRCLMGG